MPAGPKTSIAERATARQSGFWAFSEGFDLADNPWPSKYDRRGWEWRQGWFAANRANNAATASDEAGRVASS